MFNIEELLLATGGRLISGNPKIEVNGVSIDSRKIKRGNLFIAIKGPRYDGHNYINQAIKAGAKVIISQKKSKFIKGIPVILVKDTIRSLGDIAAFHRNRFFIPIVGITGSNGKTTTKDMASFLLGARFRVLKNIATENNQIGLPLTLLKLNRTHDMAVLEMGTNHFGEIKHLVQIAQPNIGVILNIGPSHLKFFGDLNSVYKEKSALINYLSFPSIAILNRDDKILKTVSNVKNNNFLVHFGLKNKSDFQAKEIKSSSLEVRFKLKNNTFRINALGSFNIYNALVAIAIARIFGVSYPLIKKRLASFESPKSRLTLRKIKGTLFIDDTYNANPASLREALNVLEQTKVKRRKIVVLGDMLELGKTARRFHTQAGKQISRICDIMITVGPLMRLAGLAAKKEGLGADALFSCDNIQEAKQILRQCVQPTKGDIILVKGSHSMKMEKIF